MADVDGIVDGADAATRLIKRYANRKLYDTRESRYVTLQHIADFVRSGEEVQIIDNRTKEDVTSVTLAQIIYEEEKSEGGDRRSVLGLRDFIKDGRNRLLTSIFEGPMGKLVPRNEGAGEPPPEARPPEAVSTAADATRDAFKSLVHAPKEVFDELHRLADDRVRALLGGALNHVQQLQGEVRRLQKRIEELEDRLGGLAKRAVKPESLDEHQEKGAASAENRGSARGEAAES